MLNSPKMYMCMKERSRYLEVILYTGIVIILVNGFVLIAGYYYFAQYVVSPSMYTLVDSPCTVMTFLFS